MILSIDYGKVIGFTIKSGGTEMYGSTGYLPFLFLLIDKLPIKKIVIEQPPKDDQYSKQYDSIIKFAEAHHIAVFHEYPHIWKHSWASKLKLRLSQHTIDSYRFLRHFLQEYPND